MVDTLPSDLFPIVSTLNVNPNLTIAAKERDSSEIKANEPTVDEGNEPESKKEDLGLLDELDIQLLEELNQFESPLANELFDKKESKTPGNHQTDAKLSLFEARLMNNSPYRFMLKRSDKIDNVPHIYTPSELAAMSEQEVDDIILQTNQKTLNRPPKREYEIKRTEGTKRLHRSLTEDDRSQLELAVGQLAAYQDGSNSHWQLKNELDLLSIEGLTILNDHITRAASVLSSCDTQCLLQIQKWCHNSVLYGCSLEWDDLGETLLSGLYQKVKEQLEAALASLISSKIILLILNGSRKDIKQIHIEEPLVAVVDFILRFVATIVSIFSFNSTRFKGQLNYCISFLSLVIATLTKYISCNDIDDSLVTKLEYLSISLIFGGMSTNDADALISLELLEGVKMDATSMILAIFKVCPDQRLFILNEIFNSMNKLTLSKTRTVKVGRGKSVQLHTALLINLLQSVDTAHMERLSGFYNTGKRPDKNTTNSIIETAREFSEQTREVAARAVEGLITSIPGGNANNRQVLQSLVEDLVSIVSLPECPAAFIYIECLFSTFINLLHSNLNKSSHQASQQETFALEMIGTISEIIFDRSQARNSSISTKASIVSTEELKELQLHIESTLLRIQNSKNKNADNQDTFHFVVLQFISYVGTLADSPVSESQLQALNSELDLLDMHLVEKILYFLLNALNDGSISVRTLPVSEIDDMLMNFKMIENHKQLYDNFVAVVVDALGSSKIKLKSRAIRILTNLVEKNNSILLQPKVQEVISDALLDTSAMVRDSSIDLITKYLTKNPEVIKGFYKVICQMLEDESTQVRKRVAKFAHLMYSSTKERRIKFYIAMKMLEGLHDEDDSIVENLKLDLADLWLSSGDYSLEIERAEIMMDVATKEEDIFRFWLESSVLGSKWQESFRSTIDSLIGFVIDGVDPEFQKDVDKAMHLISLLVQYDGKLVNQNQLLLLLSILQGENVSTNVSYKTLQIYHHAIPALNDLSPGFISSVQSYLLQNLTKFEFIELQEAVPCAWTLSSRTNSSVKLCNALISCIRMLNLLVKEISDSNVGLISDSLTLTKAKRLLDLVGSFGAHCKFDSHREYLVQAGIGLQDNETVTSLMTKYLLFFCEAKVDGMIAKIAYRGLVLVCSHNPSLFTLTSILEVLDRAFEKGDSVKIAVLQGLYNFVKLEQTVKQEGKPKKAAKRKQKFGASNVVEGISGSIVQRYTPLVLKLCLGGNSVTEAAFDLLREIVQFGLSNPKICVPTVIALEASYNVRVAEEAKKLHLHMLEHHESLVNSDYAESIRLARCVNRNSNSFLSLLYEIVYESAASRKKLITALSKTLKVQLRLGKQESLENLEVVRFVVNNTATVKFSSLEEVMTLITSIERELSREGMDLSEQLEDGTDELEDEKVSELFYLTESLSGLLHLRDYLCEKFEVSREQIESFNPRRIDPDYKRAPRVSEVGALQYTWHGNRAGHREMKEVFKRFVSEMDAFS